MCLVSFFSIVNKNLYKKCKQTADLKKTLIQQNAFALFSMVFLCFEVNAFISYNVKRTSPPKMSSKTPNDMEN